MLSYKVRISCALVCPPTTTFGQLESTDFENRRISLHPNIQAGQVVQIVLVNSEE